MDSMPKLHEFIRKDMVEFKRKGIGVASLLAEGIFRPSMGRSFYLAQATNHSTLGPASQLPLCAVVFMCVVTYVQRVRLSLEKKREVVDPTPTVDEQ